MKRLCVVIVLLVLFASFGSSPLAAQKDVAGGPMRNDASLKMRSWPSRRFYAGLGEAGCSCPNGNVGTGIFVCDVPGAAPREGVVGALTHACTLTSYSLSDVRVVPISTNSAALVYKIHQTVSCEGHPDPPVVLNTDTLVRREGKWLFLLTTSTPAE